MYLEKIKKINRAYVDDECIQVMIQHAIPYLSVIGDGIMYSASEGEEAFINTYLHDLRKLKFPYSKVPTHKERKGSVIFNYVNQIYDYNKPYVVLKDGSVFEDYAVKASNGINALLVSVQLVPTFAGKKDYLFADELRNKLEEFYSNLEGEKLIFKNGGYLISEYEFLHSHSDNSFLIVSLNGDEKQIKGVKVSKYDLFYKVEFADFPFYNYSKDYVKRFESEVTLEEEPKVKRFYNPSIPKEDIICARTMADMKNRK